MLTAEQIKKMNGRFQVLQIICAALIIGPIVAGIVLSFLRPAPKIVQDMDIISISIAGFAIVLFLAAPVVGAITLKSAANELAKKRKPESSGQKTEEAEMSWLGKLFESLQTSTIIRNAMIEGGTFASILFWFISGSVFVLGTYVIGIAWMIVLFPTKGRLANKLEELQVSSERIP